MTLSFARVLSFLRYCTQTVETSDPLMQQENVDLIETPTQSLFTDDSALNQLKHALEAELHSTSIRATSVDQNKQVLQLITEYEQCVVDSTHRSVACAALATKLWAYWEERSSYMVLAACIEVQAEMVDMHCATDNERAIACTDLSFSLKILSDITGDSGVFAEAVKLQREVMDLRPHEHPDRAKSCAALSTLLMRLFRASGDIALLNEVIELRREELDLRPNGHPLRAESCSNLAFALARRFEQTGEIALLEEASPLEREALALCPPGHAHRHISLDNLSLLLSRQFEATKEISLLDEALQLEREALSLHPLGHASRNISCGNMTVTLLRRFESKGELADLDEAIVFGREALDLCGPGHPNRGLACLNYAFALRRRYEAAHDEAQEQPTVSQIYTLIEQALELFPVSHPQRWRCYRDMAELAVRAREWARTIAQITMLLDSPSYDDVSIILRTAVDIIGRIDLDALAHEQQQALLVLYGRALDIMSVAARSALDASTQLQHIHDGNTLGLGAFTLATMTGDLASGLVLLERARGVIWSQIHEMRDPQLDEVPHELKERLQELFRGVDTSRRVLEDETPFEAVSASLSRDRLYARRGEVLKVIRQIRTLPGLGDFMRGPDAKTLMSVAVNPVVILIPGEGGCSALVISSPNGQLIQVSLPELNKQVLRDLTFAGLTGQARGVPAKLYKPERGMKVSSRTSVAGLRLAKLWRFIVKPIFEHLSLSAQGRSRPRIHWCPIGLFTFVPLHAAGIYEGPDQECASDYVVSSYTPTLTALLRAQQGARAFTADQVTMLAVAAEHVPHSRMPRLVHVMQEAQGVVGIAIRAGASGSSDADSLSRSEVLAKLETANMVHLACHGIQHPTEPHKSRFCLSTGDLSVSELMGMDLKHAFLAFLSACETAKGNPKHADESVHLAATMLFAGFKSVVATMWAMNDVDGPYVANSFYEKLFDGPMLDFDAVPYALDHAVTALRRKGVPPERWATFVHMGA